MNTRIDRKKLLIGTYILDKYARTEEHVKQLKEAGIDLVVCLRDADRGILDLLDKYGIGCVLCGVVPGWWGGDGANAGTMCQVNTLDRFVDAAVKFVDHPAVWMIDIGDEPSAKDFDHIGKIVAKMEELFPRQLPYLNLYPNYASVAENSDSQALNQLGTVNYAEHIREYIEKVPLPYISYDYYVYAMGVSGLAKMYENFDVVARACRETGRDFWYIPQCNGRHETDFTSVNQMRFQAYCALCYGAAAVNWACWTAGWWCNFVLDSEGNKTEQYDKIRDVNRELRQLDTRYMNYRVVSTHLVDFRDVPTVRNDRELKVVDELNCGFVRGLKASGIGVGGSESISENIGNGALVVGEMVGRDDLEKHALLILNATDFLDAQNGIDPKANSVKVSFETKGREVKVTGFTPEGETLPEELGFAEIGEDNVARNVSFRLDNCRAAFVEIKL